MVNNEADSVIPHMTVQPVPIMPMDGPTGTRQLVTFTPLLPPRVTTSPTIIQKVFLKAVAKRKECTNDVYSTSCSQR